ncbi:MAG: hypothetical protein ACF8R7_11865 [Phycisphaerales bacterium JB039]
MRPMVLLFALVEREQVTDDLIEQFPADPGAESLRFEDEWPDGRAEPTPAGMRFVVVNIPQWESMDAPDLATAYAWLREQFPTSAIYGGFDHAMCAELAPGPDGLPQPAQRQRASA